MARVYGLVVQEHTPEELEVERDLDIKEFGGNSSREVMISDILPTPSGGRCYVLVFVKSRTIFYQEEIVKWK